MVRQLIGILGVLAVVAACSSAEEPGPFDAEAQIRPELVVADPGTVRAGDLVELSFPEETERGVPWILEEEDGDTWHQRFLLWSDGNGGTPDWVGPEQEDRWAWNDVGVGGPGPDTVLVPDTTPEGRYRLCTANAPANFCAALEVTG